jgi:hypothetical protein
LFTIIVHLDSEGGWVHHGPALPAGLLEQVGCDGRIQALWSRHGLPVNVGRSRRIVPRRTRIVVEDRDRTCRHPACTATAHLDHVVHWSRGGRTDTGNSPACAPGTIAPTTAVSSRSPATPIDPTG